MSREEPWLRGPVEGVVPELQPAAHALLFAKEELDRISANLHDEHIWQTPNGTASIGYHVRHCSGSTLRMLTYARGQSLSEQQLAEIATEAARDPTLTTAGLFTMGHAAIDAALEFIRATPAEQLDEPRFVGRKRLPSNVRGLIYEIVVHTARHVGQLATTARAANASPRA